MMISRLVTALLNVEEGKIFIVLPMGRTSMVEMEVIMLSVMKRKMPPPSVAVKQKVVKVMHPG